MLRALLKIRLLISSLILTGLLLIALSVVVAYNTEATAAGDLPASAELLANATQSDDECVVCHTDQTPGIVNQYLDSDHFRNDVSCSNCHEVDEDYPGAVQHPEQEFFVIPKSTPAQCETCHLQQVQQFNLSRHGLPAYVAYAGTDPLNEEQQEIYASIPEGGFLPEIARARNALHNLEGEEITLFACETCHNVGKPNPDGSVGDCTACHLRHQFNLEQVRKPETCNACHIGPDHPQWEIYQESPHGIAYMTLGHEWNWEADPGTLTTADFMAPTCATCHFSGFGLASTTHDVGDRLTWFLAMPISARRPAWQENRLRMQGVCQACHSENYIDTFYENADAGTLAVNDFVAFSDAMMQPLKDNGLLTPQPFDEPIDYVYYELWHHWGRTAKFGMWMQGPDYTQWHGAYELLADLAELRELIDARPEANGMEPLDLPETFPSIDAAREYLNPPADTESVEATAEPGATPEPTAEATEAP